MPNVKIYPVICAILLSIGCFCALFATSRLFVNLGKNVAAAMCPTRFMPLYQLAEMYDETGRTKEAMALARQIVEKEVKTISATKQKMRQLIEKTEAKEITVPAPESRTTNQPQTTNSGSGDFSDVPRAPRPP